MGVGLVTRGRASGGHHQAYVGIDDDLHVRGEPAGATRSTDLPVADWDERAVHAREKGPWPLDDPRTWSVFLQFSGHDGGLRLILYSVTERISLKAVVVSLLHQGVLRDAFAEVSRFRSELYACLTARGDALFE